MIAFLLKLIFGIVLLAIAAALFLTWQTGASANEGTFTKGTIPQPALGGAYKGSANIPVKVTWVGKKFDVGTTTGMNIFEDGLGSTTEKYPFKYYEAAALREPGIKVIAIDYDLPENPFWVRPIIDELVEVAPGKYLGKMHVRVVPGYPFTLTFFRLEK